MGRSSVSGLPGLTRALERLGTQIHAGSESATDEGAESLAQTMRDLAPVDEGELLDGIDVRDAEDGIGKDAGVYDVDHAAAVEFGTSTAPAQPYALPAAELERTRFPDRVRSHVGKAVQ